MALRSILVHLGAGERAASRIAAAAALAIQHEAHLVGVAPTGWPTMSADWSGGTGVIGYVEAAVQALREQAQGAARRDTLRRGIDVFAALLRQHIALEESVIYPEARRLLGDEKAAGERRRSAVAGR